MDKKPVAVKIFIVSSPKDEDFRKDLEKALTNLEQQQIIEILSISGKKQRELRQEAQLILLLISMDFLYEKLNEMEPFIKQYHEGKLIIPVILRPGDYTRVSFLEEMEENILPGLDNPISRWSDREEIYTQVVLKIRQKAEAIYKEINDVNPQEEIIRLREQQEREDNYCKRGNIEKEIKAFLRLPHDEQWLLLLTGFPGSGRTTLLKWLERHTDPGDAATTISLNFANIYDYTDLLRELAECIRPILRERELSEDEEEPSIDEELQDEEDTPSFQPPRRSESDIVFPQVSEMTRANERERQREAFLDLLNSCYMEVPDLNLWLLCDAFETAPEAERKWIWQFMDDAHKTLPGLKVVIASQERMDTGISDAKELSLLCFSASESKTFLQNEGITSKEWISIIQDTTHGHPLLLSWAVDIWKTAEETHQPFAPFDRPKNTDSEEDVIQWIQERISQRLEGPLAEAIRWGILLHSFTLDSINAILFVDGTGLSNNQFTMLQNYSFVIPAQEEGSYTFHPYMRKSLKENIRHRFGKKQYYSIHKRAYTYYHAKPHPDNKATISALYHHFQFDAEQALQEWNSVRKAVRERRDTSFLAVLMQMVDENHISELPLNEDQRAFITLKEAHFYRRTAKYEQSLVAYQFANDFYEKLVPPASEYDIQSQNYINLIRSKHGLAVLYGMKRQYKDSQAIFEELIKVYKREKDTYVSTAWGQLEAKKGDREAARAKFTEALQYNETHLHTINVWALYEMKWHEYKKADGLVQRALTLASTDSREYVTTLTIIARLAHLGGDITGARLLYEQIAENGITTEMYLRYYAFLEKEAKDNFKAKSLFNRLKENHPNSTTSLLNWAIMEYQYPEGDIESARQIFDKIIQVDSKHKKTLLTWAHCERSLSNYSEAKALFTRIVAVDPGNIVARWNIAHLAEKLGDLQEAEEVLQEILTITKYQYVPVLNAKARLARMRGTLEGLEEAERLLELSKEYSPKAYSTLYMQALIEQDPAKRRALLWKVKKANPKHVPTLIQLARMERDDGKLMEAEELLNRAMWINLNQPDTLYRKTHPVVLYDKAMVAKLRNHLEEAEESFNKVLALPPNPHDPTRSKRIRIRTLRSLASVKWKQEQYEEARAHYKEIVFSLSKSNMKTFLIWAWYERSIKNDEIVQQLIDAATRVPLNEMQWITRWGVQEAHSGNRVGARQLFEHAMQYRFDGLLVAAFARFEYDEARFAETKADIECAQERYEEARKLFAQAYELLPRNVNNLTYWATMEFSLGNIEEARTHFEQALMFDERDIRTLKRWAHLEWGHNGPNRRERSAKLFARILERRPDNIDALWELAKLKDKQGHLQEASDLLKRTLDLDEEHVRALNALAEIENKRGHPKEANELAERAREIKPDALTTLWIQARKEFRRKNYEKAHYLLLQIDKVEPYHVGALKFLALLERKKVQEIERELQQTRRIVARNVATFEDWPRQSQTLLKYRDIHYQQAEDYLQKALESGQENIGVLEDWANLPRITGNLKRSAKRFADIIDKWGDYPGFELSKKIRIWRLWADVEWKMGNYDQARSLFRKILAAKPNNMRTFLVWIRKEKGRKDNEERIINIVKRALDTKDIDDVYWITRWAKEEAREGNTKRARRLFKHAEDKKPMAHSLASFAIFEYEEHHYSQARRLFALAENQKPQEAELLRWAIMEHECNNSAMARDIFKRSLEATPQRKIHILQTWAELEKKQCCYQEAIDLYASIIAIEPENLPVLKSQAELELRLDHEKEARLLFQRIRILEPNYQAPIFHENLWKPVPIEERHRAILANRGELHTVLQATLFLVKGRAHLTMTQKTVERPLETFVARCLLSLAPCTARQITFLLKLKTSAFAMIILKQLQNKQIVARTDDGYWHVQDRDQLQTFLDEHNNLHKKEVGFIYDWKNSIFLPGDIDLDTWPGIHKLDTIPQDEEIALDPKFVTDWGKKTLESGLDNTEGEIRWDRNNYQSAWVLPLEVIIYQPASQSLTWMVVTSQTRQSKDFKMIARILDIKKVLPQMVKQSSLEPVNGSVSKITQEYSFKPVSIVESHS